MSDYTDIDEANTEIARLRALITAEPTLERCHYEAGKPLDVAIRHPMVQAITRALRDTLHATDVPNKPANYVELVYEDTASMTCHDLELEPPSTYVVTIQRQDGATPHQLRAKAEAKLRDVLAWLRSGIYSETYGIADEIADAIEQGAPTVWAESQ